MGGSLDWPPFILTPLIDERGCSFICVAERTAGGTFSTRLGSKAILYSGVLACQHPLQKNSGAQIYKPHSILSRNPDHTCSSPLPYLDSPSIMAYPSPVVTYGGPLCRVPR